MIILYAFLFGGITCLVGQIILDNTNLTPGHVNSIFVILGSFLSCIGLYELFLKYAGGGASIMILNFGNLLYEGAILGFKTGGIFGIFKGILVPASCGLSITIFFAFLMAVLSKPKN